MVPDLNPALCTRALHPHRADQNKWEPLTPAAFNQILGWVAVVMSMDAGSGAWEQARTSTRLLSESVLGRVEEPGALAGNPRRGGSGLLRAMEV